MEADIKRRGRCVEFANWLRDQMQGRSDLNQRRLADLVGVNASNVSFWLSGRSKPSLDKIDVIADIFGVEPNTLYQLLGFDVGQPYSFKEIGPIMERLDRTLAQITDPEIRAIAEARIGKDILALIDTIESVTQLVDAITEAKQKE